MGQIRRIDDLGRIAIPKEIRQEIMTQEGDAFNINIIGRDSILITKVKEKERFKDNIVYLKRYIKDSNVKKEFDDNSVKEISNKLDDICKIIDFSLKK